MAFTYIIIARDNDNWVGNSLSALIITYNYNGPTVDIMFILVIISQT